MVGEKIYVEDDCWETHDEQGLDHSYNGCPSYYHPDSNFGLWCEHGLLHLECGSTYREEAIKWEWHLHDIDLEGRMLLW